MCEEKVTPVLLTVKELAIDGNGVFTGIIKWDVNGVSFPDAKWNDFVVVVLGWWVESLHRIVVGTSTNEILRFMDGPFFIVCSRSGEKLECKFMRHGSSSSEITQCGIELIEFVGQVCIAGRTIQSVCSAKNFENKDVSNLERNVRRLETSLARHKRN